jgi:hypothetical protein
MKRHFLATTTLALALLAGGTRGGEKAGSPDAPLAAAVGKTAGLDSYSFSIAELPGQGTGGTLQGKYEKGQPVNFTADGIEFYRQGKTLVYKDGGKWHKSKTGVQSDPLRILGGAAKVRAARLPHEELPELLQLAAWDKKPEAVAKDGKLYTGTLDAAAAKKLAPTAVQSVAQGGQAKVQVGADGRVTSYVLTIRLLGKLGNAQVDGMMTRTVTLANLGSARVEVPDEARKVLE